MFHFIGIGGIGMSALARIVQSRGAKVQGSDTAAGYLLEGLKKEGITVFPAHDRAHVKPGMDIVYSTGILPHHSEYAAALQQGNRILHRSELLAKLMEGKEALLVTGTHGKTTTSVLLAHVVQCAGLDASFALGGIPLNYGVNGYHGAGSYFVAEADESDGSFLNYRGKVGIITNIEEDHMTYWKTREALIEGFRLFAAQVKEGVWWCQDDPTLTQLALKGKSYGFSPHAHLQITHFSQNGWGLTFDLKQGNTPYHTLTLPLIGRHNALNAAAVFGLALDLGIQENIIRTAFQTFRGVKRRMERRGEKRGVLFFDDYAHHPTEIQTTLEAARKACGKRRLVAIFQPHRFSRFTDCWDLFLESFHAADLVCVTDVYGAGEEPIEGVTGKKFAEALKHKIPTLFIPREELSHAHFLRPHDVAITLGAGDITNLDLSQCPIEPLQMTVLQGGRSAEHEVSLLSSKTISAAIDPDLYTVETWTISKEGGWGRSMADVITHLLTQDLIFPILHGPFGEDGMLQGFFETLNIPYVGPDFRACVVAMDKAWTKAIAQSYGIHVVRFLSFSVEAWQSNCDSIKEQIITNFSPPFYIKAVHLGSTFGVHRITAYDEIASAINSIAQLDYAFLVEEEVIGREIEFGFLGDTVSEGAEVIRSDAIHTYENKYSLSGNPSIPQAPMPFNVMEAGKKAATTVYQALHCSSLARIDFFLTADGRWILNEVNPIPGFTPMSVYPAIWKAEGLSMREVINEMVIASLYRHRMQRKSLQPPKVPPMEL